MATIEARGLRKTYGTTTALDGIDLRVEEGRILGLIGPNGAGKTTALDAILGLLPAPSKPSAGTSRNSNPATRSSAAEAALSRSMSASPKRT